MPSIHCRGSQSVTDPCSDHSVSRSASRYRLRRRQRLTRSSTFTFGVVENRGHVASAVPVTHRVAEDESGRPGSLCCDSATWRGIQIVLPALGTGAICDKRGSAWLACCVFREAAVRSAVSCWYYSARGGLLSRSSGPIFSSPTLPAPRGCTPPP